MTNFPEISRRMLAECEGKEGIERHLCTMVALRGDTDGKSFDAFILKHGRRFVVDADSYIGSLPAKQCYGNAAMTAINEGLTYVEGYTTVCGLPIQHAWNISKDGKVRDYTLDNDDAKYGGREFFGVPFKTEFLRRTVLKKGTFQLFDWMEPKFVIDGDAAKKVKKL